MAKIKYKIIIYLIIFIGLTLLIPSLLYSQIGDRPHFLEFDELSKDYVYTPSVFEIHFMFSLALENRLRETLIYYRGGFALLFDYLYIEIILDKEQNKDFANYHRNWTSIRQFIAKINTISYGVYNVTNIYAYIGDIYDFSAGTGTIMKYYTNANQSPLIPGVGSHIDINFDFIRFELMIADLITPDLFGSYISLKPLDFFDFGFYKELEIGGTFAIDVNPYEISYYDRNNEPPVNEYGTTPVIRERWTIVLDYNSIDPNIDNMLGWSIYLIAPIWSFSKIDFKAMFEFASEKGLGNAFRFGLNGSIANTFDYRLEFIVYQRGFIPSLFFTQYENRKVNRYIKGLEYKDEAFGTPFGLYIEIGRDIIPNRLGFVISFEDYFDDYESIEMVDGNKVYDEIEGEMTIRFYLKEIVKGLGIEILINKWDMNYNSVADFFEETVDKTMWYFKFYWWLTPNAQFSLLAQNFFLMMDEGWINKQHIFSIQTIIYI